MDKYCFRVADTETFRKSTAKSDEKILITSFANNGTFRNVRMTLTWEPRTLTIRKRDEEDSEEKEANQTSPAFGDNFKDKSGLWEPIQAKV